MKNTIKLSAIAIFSMALGAFAFISATEITSDDYSEKASNPTELLAVNVVDFDSKCGEGKKSEKKEKEGAKKSEGKEEHKCGEGKCGEGKSATKKEEKKPEQKKEEHKCGEGKCGGQ
ncbi:MAG: hypothetical protein ACPGD5_07030 [Salibacteraceae bacterium]